MPRAALALIVCGAALGAGCGDSDDDPAPATSTDNAAETSLTIAVAADGELGGPRALVKTFSCPGADAAVCDAVDAIPEDPDAEIDPSTPCTEVYGGPDALRVEGTLRGETIDASFSRENGCAIEQFDQFTPLLEALFPDYQPGSQIGA